jgi:hypothetical protein
VGQLAGQDALRRLPEGAIVLGDPSVGEPHEDERQYCECSETDGDPRGGGGSGH